MMGRTMETGTVLENLLQCQKVTVRDWSYEPTFGYDQIREELHIGHLSASDQL